MADLGRQITGIIIHCSATRKLWMHNATVAEKRDEIKSWHVDDNGWSDIGYHGLIDRDGSVAEGRPIGRNGAHCIGQNRGTIGLCLIGGHGSAANDAPEDHYTPEQLLVLARILEGLQEEHPGVTISGHNQHANKACPGFNVPAWLQSVGLIRSEPQSFLDRLANRPRRDRWGRVRPGCHKAA